MEVHASLHVAVETQIAAVEPPAVLLALRRLMAEGLSRHDAVHAIGWLAAEHLKRAMNAEQAVDVDAYAADLASLSRESWLASAGPSPRDRKPLLARRRSD